MHTIRALRDAAGLTQLELANRVGVTPVTVFNWERRRHEPTARQLRALALALGVSMDVIDFEKVADTGKRRDREADDEGAESESTP